MFVWWWGSTRAAAASDAHPGDADSQAGGGGTGLDPHVFMHPSRVATGAEVIGAELASRTGIPKWSECGAKVAADLATLAQTIKATGVDAVFANTAHSTELVDALASEVGRVQAAPFYGDSIGKPGSGADTYQTMTTTNARRIAGACPRPTQFRPASQAGVAEYALHRPPSACHGPILLDRPLLSTHGGGPRGYRCRRCRRWTSRT